VSLQPQIDEDVGSSACWLRLLPLRSSASSLLHKNVFWSECQAVMKHRQNNKWQEKKELWVGQHHSYWPVVLATLYALTCVKKPAPTNELMFPDTLLFSNDNPRSVPRTLALALTRYNVRIRKSWAALRKGQSVFHHASYCTF
jgi:hypothetical protein